MTRQKKQHGKGHLTNKHDVLISRSNTINLQSYGSLSMVALTHYFLDICTCLLFNVIESLDGIDEFGDHLPLTVNQPCLPAH